MPLAHEGVASKTQCSAVQPSVPIEKVTREAALGATRRNSASPVSPENEELYSRVMKRSHPDEVYSRIMKRYLEQHQDQDEMYSRVMKRSPEFLENGQITPRLCPDSAAELRHLSGRALNTNHQLSLFSLSW